jgi:hypothetical protein
MPAAIRVELRRIASVPSPSPGGGHRGGGSLTPSAGVGPAAGPRPARRTMRNRSRGTPWWASPAQVDAEVPVGGQPRQLAVGAAPVALLGQGRGDARRPAHGHVPVGRIGGDRGSPRRSRQQHRGRLRPDARQARDAVGVVTDQRQQVRHRGGCDPEPFPDPGLVADGVTEAVDLDDPLARARPARGPCPGLSIRTWPTSLASCTAAEASRSSASTSTQRQTWIPRAATACSAPSSWASNAGSTPSELL